MKMRKRLTAAALALVMLSATGCTSSGGNGNGKISVSIGNWPVETDTASLELKKQQKAEFETMYPDITIVPDTYKFEGQTFTAKATAKQLPDVISNLPYTEAKTVIKNGYAADITDLAKQYGLFEALNPAVVEMCTDENGRLYLLPNGIETPGIAINKEIFKKAGLVNPDGTVMTPDTFEEVAEFA